VTSHATTTTNSLAPPSTTLPPTTTVPKPSQVITSASPTGPIVWQSGDSVPPSDNAYEGYYCCIEPFPDGMNRSGSAGCSGQAGQGGYYLNGVLC
jgi:hypothetical protein